MKNNTIIKIFLVLLFMQNHSALSQEFDLDISTTINANQKFVEFWIENYENFPIYCQWVKQKVSYVDAADNNRVYGQRVVSIRDISIAPQQLFHEPEGGREIIEAWLADNRNARIKDFVGDVSFSCKKDQENIPINKLSINSTQTGSLPKEAKIYYSITIDTTQTFSIETMGSLDTFLSIYHAKSLEDLGSPLYTNDDGGENTNAKIKKELDPGTYIVEVKGYSSQTTGDYDIGISNRFGTHALLWNKNQGILSIENVTTKEKENVLQDSSLINYLSWVEYLRSDDQRHFIIAKDKKAVIIDLKYSKIISRVYTNFECDAISYNHKKGFFACTKKPGDLEVWNTRTNKMLTSLKVEDGNINTPRIVNFSHYGSRLYVKRDLNVILSIDTSNWQNIWSEKVGSTDYQIHSLSTSLNNNMIAAGSVDRRAYVFDNQGNKLKSFYVGSYLGGIGFSPNNRWLITGGEKSELFIWDVESGNKIHDLSHLVNDNTDGIDGVFLSNDLRYVGATYHSWSPEGRLIDLHTKQLVPLNKTADEMVIQFLDFGIDL